MPVFPEVLKAPLTPQDRTDLIRLYTDAPEAWQLNPETLESFVDDALAHEQLWGARFNGRLLGAACVQQSPQGWHVSHFCVRALTRQRGVGNRLFDELLQRATAIGAPLFLQQPGQAPQPIAPNTRLRALLQGS